MYLLWILIFIIFIVIGIVVCNKSNKEVLQFTGSLLTLISSIILICMIGFGFSHYYEIKKDIIKIEAIQSVIKSENILYLKDTTVNNLSPDILLEKKIQYNERIIEWKYGNKWYNSAIITPSEVETIEPIK